MRITPLRATHQPSGFVELQRLLPGWAKRVDLIPLHWMRQRSAENKRDLAAPSGSARERLGACTRCGQVRQLVHPGNGELLPGSQPGSLLTGSAKFALLLFGRVGTLGGVDRLTTKKQSGRTPRKDPPEARDDPVVDAVLVHRSNRPPKPAPARPPAAMPARD